MTPSPAASLRRCALAASVLHDVDILPADGGLLLPGRPLVAVGWQECERALAGADPETSEAHGRLARWLSARRLLADRPLAEVVERARPVALPPGHALHPGPRWVRRRVLGGALDLGLGFVGLDPDRPDDVDVVPDGALHAAGVDASAWWGPAESYLQRMGARAVERWQRRPDAPLRPMGDCDAITLLASGTLRRALVAGEPDGMRAVVAPMRTRAWLDPSRTDPAFAVTAASLTEPEHRGFARPVLITADEVVLARPGGRPAEIALRDPAAPETWEGLARGSAFGLTGR